MLTQNLISGISDIMGDGGLIPLCLPSLSFLFPSPLSLYLPLSAVPIKACTFVLLEFDSIISPQLPGGDELCHGDPSCLLQH